MTEALIWLVVLAVIGLMFWALVRDHERLKNRTAAEYERDLAESRNSMLRAGMLELDKFLVSEKEKRAAVEMIKDTEQGKTKSGGKGDDLDRTASE
jgi:Tfp pilus assembly protein PilX